MKTQKLTIRIKRPATEVFDFVTDSKNTPKWIDFIAKEETNEWPPRLGTVYHNQDSAGVWQDLEMTEFEQDKMFVMTNRKTGYNVRYTLTPTDSGTKLEYYEWMDNGDLDEPFTMEPLQKLKSILESSA